MTGKFSQLSDLDPISPSGNIIIEPPGIGPKLRTDPECGIPDSLSGTYPSGARFDPFNPPGNESHRFARKDLNVDYDHLQPVPFQDSA